MLVLPDHLGALGEGCRGVCRPQLFAEGADLVAANGKIDANGQVLGFIPDWRPLRDLNPCSHRERDGIVVSC